MVNGKWLMPFIDINSSMKENVIKNKSFDFALQVIKLYKEVSENKKEYVMSKQLLRSGTGVWALVAEAEHAESKMDFVHKMAIAQKEANETLYWLELLHKSEYIADTIYEKITNQLIQIQKIITAIITTSKKRW